MIPVKRRRSKRRVSDLALAEAWAMTFRGGYDFMGDLQDLGISEAAMSRDVFRAAAAEAWDKFGLAFLARWEPDVTTPTADRLWAVQEFGLPREVKPCR